MRKRILSVLLVCVMVLGLIPVSFASNTVLYGVDVRTSEIAGNMQAGQTKVSVQATSHVLYQNYQKRDDISETHSWASMYYFAYDIPEGQQNEYSPYTLNEELTVYIKMLSDDDRFVAGEDYLCIVNLEANNGTTFDSHCLVSGLEPEYIITSSNSMTVNLVVTCSASVPNIDALPIGLNFVDPDSDAVELNLPDQVPSYTYYCRWSSGSSADLALGDCFDADAGCYVVDMSRFDPAEGGFLNLDGGKPCAQIIRIKSADEGNPVAAVYGYGLYVLPVYDPRISVDVIEPGLEPTIQDFSCGVFGHYSENFATVTFNGWFSDENCTAAFQTNQDAYAKFTIDVSSGMIDGFAMDATLTDGVTEFLPCQSNTISDTQFSYVYYFGASSRYTSVTCSGGNGNESAVFEANHQNRCMFVPDDSGNIFIDIRFTKEESVYLSKVFVDENEYPVTEPNASFIFLTLSESPEQITLVFAQCDVLTIAFNPDDGMMFYNGFGANENHTYYVNEIKNKILFVGASYYRFVDGHRQTLAELNTSADRTGTRVLNCTWVPVEPYINGIRDNITLYPIFYCDEHIQADDTVFWIYHEAQASACGHAGNIAYRECKYCGKCEILVNNEYIDALPGDIFLDYMPHDYQYTYNGDGTHTATCSRCQDSYTENCSYGEYTDNGDGTHSHSCTQCQNTVTGKHNYQDGVCTECGNTDAPTYIIGDVNDDGEVTDADARYLLYYTIFGEEDYPISQPVDYNGDGEVTDADARYLLYYTIFGEEDYPLNVG